MENGHGGTKPLILPDGTIVHGRHTASQALDQFGKRTAKDYEDAARRLAALSQYMARNGAVQDAVDHVARAALLMAEVYVAKREGVF